jgi:hypothetical protein
MKSQADGARGGEAGVAPGATPIVPTMSRLSRSCLWLGHARSLLTWDAHRARKLRDRQWAGCSFLWRERCRLLSSDSLELSSQIHELSDLSHLSRHPRRHHASLSQCLVCSQTGTLSPPPS